MTQEFKGQPNREIKINNSYLEITGCAHAAMTIDPIDITLSSSNVVVMDNGKSDPDGYGFGIGCYGGKLTMGILDPDRHRKHRRMVWLRCFR